MWRMGAPASSTSGSRAPGPQVPQPVALDLADIAPGLFVQKIPIGPVSKDDAALGVDDGDALPHGVEGGAGGGVELHRLPSFL